MKKIVTTTLGLFLWASGSFAAETHYQLQVDGLVCPFCEYNVQKKLSKLDGVLEVKVNLKEGQVIVLVAVGKTLIESQARTELLDAGFTLQSVKTLEGYK